MKLKVKEGGKKKGDGGWRKNYNRRDFSEKTGVLISVNKGKNQKGIFII